MYFENLVDSTSLVAFLLSNVLHDLDQSHFADKTVPVNDGLKDKEDSEIPSYVHIFTFVGGSSENRGSQRSFLTMSRQVLSGLSRVARVCHPWFAHLCYSLWGTKWLDADK